MPMPWLEAMTILGLAYSDIQDLVAIRRAWKTQLRKCHPDKNQLTSGDATIQTQRMNEAKDVLVVRVKENNDDARWREELARRREFLERELVREQALLDRVIRQHEDERRLDELRRSKAQASPFEWIREEIRLADERRAQAVKEREEAFKKPFTRLWSSCYGKKARSK
jgi:curved DNA-binding protein CbpA